MKRAKKLKSQLFKRSACPFHPNSPDFTASTLKLKADKNQYISNSDHIDVVNGCKSVDS